MSGLGRAAVGGRRGGRAASGASRLLAAALAALALPPAAAFDSETWFGKREVLDREAERLQAAYADCAARAVAPAENVVLPVESHPDGSIKATVSAKAAQFFLQTGFVWGTNVVVRQYATNGVVEAEVVADRCVVDRGTKSGWVDGHARARYLGNEVEGDGIYFSFSEEFVRISSNTVIRAKDLKFDTKVAAGKANCATGGAEVVSRRTDYDRRDGVVLFEGGVRASDSGRVLGADRLFVFLDGTNSLRRLVADGGVSIADGLRSGSCARAAYVRSSGRVTMYGDAAPARLVEEGPRRNTVEGRRIAYWLDSDQVEIEGASITVDGGVSGGKAGILERLGK